MTTESVREAIRLELTANPAKGHSINFCEECDGLFCETCSEAETSGLFCSQECEDKYNE